MIFILLLLCHWAGDYTHLSMPSMLAAKRFGKPLLPIFLHAYIHTLLILFVLVPYQCFYTGRLEGMWQSLLLMLVSHFLIDVWKGRMNAWFPKLQDPKNVFHWWVFGIDQFLHTAIIFLIYNMVK